MEMRKASPLLLFVAIATIAFAADAEVLFTKDVSPNNGLGFDSVKNVVLFSLSAAMTEGRVEGDVTQATVLPRGTILIGSSKFDKTCFKAELQDVMDDEGKKVADKKLAITYYATCQTCESDNRVQIALTTEIDKILEFGFRINCVADTVFVSNGEWDDQSVLRAIAAYAVKMKSERVKYINIQNELALSDGAQAPFSAETNYLSGELIRENRIKHIKEKVLGMGIAGRKRADPNDKAVKTLIIIGNPPPTTRTAVTGYFPLIKKKFSGTIGAEYAVENWEYEVPIDRLYDADFGEVLDTGSFADGDYMVVSRIPGYPKDAALTAKIINNFLKEAENGAVTVSKEPLIVASGGDEVGEYAETATPQILTDGTSSKKFMWAPDACKSTKPSDGVLSSEKDVCNYDSLKTELKNNDNFLSITHGNGNELGAKKADVWYSVLTVSVKTDIEKNAPLLVAGTNCFESSLDCAYSVEGCSDLTPFATSNDLSLVRALGKAGALLVMGHSRTSLYPGQLKMTYGTKKATFVVPSPVIETLLYAREKGVTVGEALNKVDLDYLKGKMENCEETLLGIFDESVDKERTDFKTAKDNIENFCDTAKQETTLKWNLYGTNLIGIPKVKLA